MKNKWRFWIDRGGTFTDVIGVSPGNFLYVDKTPSADGDGGLAAVRAMLQLPALAKLPASQVAEIRIGATIATNALLERSGEKTAVCVTRGFADALIIGDQTRPDLFVLHNSRPPRLWSDVVEIDERMAVNGSVVLPLDEVAAKNALTKLVAKGVNTVAISLMHGFSYPQHEKKLAKIARAVGMRQIVVSHQAAPFIKYIPRSHTAVAEAYLSRPMRNFICDIQKQCEDDIRLLFMQSSGALIAGDSLQAVRTILSGPAGGATGARKSAKAAGFDRIICFDMGGTSTDVTLGGAELRLENHVGGVSFFAPMLDIHTVAAGGGSIIRRQDNRLLVGPQSAGAVPGPACYRQGGVLTITDCNVMLGKLQPDFFPAIFGKKHNLPIDADIVHKKFLTLASGEQSPAAMAEGFVQVAVRRMAAAIRRISTARGIDARTCVINSFGGASGQHICLVADAIGASSALVSRYASVLSAWGIGMADIGTLKRQTTECPLSAPALATCFTSLQKQALADMPKDEKRPTIYRRVLCRYEGAENTIAVNWQSAKKMRDEFEKNHRRYYGYVSGDKKVIAAAAEVETVISASALPAVRHRRVLTEAVLDKRAVFFNGKQCKTPFYDWRQLPNKYTITGPAIVCDKWNTVVVEPGWRATTSKDNLLLRRVVQNKTEINPRHVSPAWLEIFHHRFMAIAEQMGENLRRTAMSVNIRERLDFSCALFDGRGNLIANAPHIPVHLGSMGASVLHLIRRNPPGILQGDSFMLNSPYHGGTHLPDITLIRPGRLDGKNGKPDYFVAARGHHADIGGVSPGSMPAASSHIEEEGVLINLITAVQRGQLCEKEILQLLTTAKYPARNPAQNLADLRAQIAALAVGVAEMNSAVAEFGSVAIASYMRHLQNNAARACRRMLRQLKDGKTIVHFDDGAKIAIAIRINHEKQTATFDFSGTSPQHPHNFNAPRAVTRAAIIYCLRVLLGEDMPLNDGLMRPIKIIIPHGSMLSPRMPAAVAAGNVEVSQHIVDAIFAALKVCAHSQGTCNNFTLGSGDSQYYETICGGSGAGPTFAGSDAMQVHMTNSRASDAEILEAHYPLRLERFTFRRGSGGAGRYGGGMGAVRHIRFLESGEATVLSSRRTISPCGMEGGADGKSGRNAIRRANGKTEVLGGCARAEMKAGDVFIIETPGGGGWGKKG